MAVRVGPNQRTLRALYKVISPSYPRLISQAMILGASCLYFLSPVYQKYVVKIVSKEDNLVI